jgi:predicted nuclease of predicted toxin-antitoxin system
MTKLYSNENFPLPAVEELRRLGYDVLTIQESGKAGQSLSDESVLAFACAEGRMLVTHNRKHFIILHKHQYEHCGIIVCTVDADFVRLAHRIHEAIQTQVETASPLIRVNRPN